jgi:hypothetical protein
MRVQRRSNAIYPPVEHSPDGSITCVPTLGLIGLARNFPLANESGPHVYSMRVIHPCLPLRRSSAQLNCEVERTPLQADQQVASEST